MHLQPAMRLCFPKDDPPDALYNALYKATIQLYTPVGGPHQGFYVGNVV